MPGPDFPAQCSADLHPVSCSFNAQDRTNFDDDGSRSRYIFVCSQVRYPLCSCFCSLSFINLYSNVYLLWTLIMSDGKHGLGSFRSTRPLLKDMTAIFVGVDLDWGPGIATVAGSCSAGQQHALWES